MIYSLCTTHCLHNIDDYVITIIVGMFYFKAEFAPL